VVQATQPVAGTVASAVQVIEVEKWNSSDSNTETAEEKIQTASEPPITNQVSQRNLVCDGQPAEPEVSQSELPTSPAQPIEPYHAIAELAQPQNDEVVVAGKPIRAVSTQTPEAVKPVMKATAYAIPKNTKEQTMKEIIQEKLTQAVALLNEQNLDCWLTFVRETSQVHDPALDLILGFGVTWDSAFIFGKGGEKIAIVGRYDGDNIRKLEAYDQVLTYDQGIRETLREALARLNPNSIGLNYSLSDTGSDGLTFGMYARLISMLGDTPYAARFTSADGVVRRLRERKSASEIARIKTTIEKTQQVYEMMMDLPLIGMSEKQVHAVTGDFAAHNNCEFGWERVNNPIVNAGPESSIGHGIPSDLKIAPGQIVHFDMGLRHQGYCSDLQRVAYARRDGEMHPPEEVTKAWDACWAALEVGRAALKPGVVAWQVDAAARAELVKQGYDEYLHAFGHHVGRNVHDGGSVLGPRWERYGQLPNMTIEPNNVFAIELGVMLPGYGYIGIEENVVVTESGAEWLSEPQRELMVI
jgi:Xaa-Pro aminopeptidase